MPNLTDYASFLIRIWNSTCQDSGKSQEEWHGELECIQSGQSWNFKCPEAFFTVLQEQVEKVGSPHTQEI
jgi:hypothetical protein